jgi:tripartite-type tricarboxylate transporter receptor subunit TctC
MNPLIRRSDDRNFLVAPVAEGDAMKLRRRQFLQLAAGTTAAALAPASSRLAWAQAYPARPVRLLVGFAVGGVTDIVARLMGQWLSERLGQQFFVENRTGAATNVATEALVRAAPDGYTLLMASASNAINATLYDNLNFNFIRDTTPIASVIGTPLVMLVNPSFPARTVPAFIAYAKENPGQINMASSGSGSPPHVAGELFKMMAGVNMVHVPYRGDLPAITDLLARQVQVYFGTLPASIEYVKAGHLRALAVTGATRSQALPDIAPLGEFLPGYEATIWNGLNAPKNTPAVIVEKLNREINAVLADPKFKARLAELGATPVSGTPADYAKLIADETEKWGKVVKLSGARAE